MILNASGRTDMPQYYLPWLLRRFDEGLAYSRNPLFPDKVTCYDLSPDVVDCIFFCSKNYAPIIPHLDRFTSEYHTYFHYTITAYGSDVEPGVPDIGQSIDTLIELSERVGRGRVVWRYDPVLLTHDYTIERHIETFDAMARRIAPHVSHCLFSFVEVYKKLEHNMPELVIMTERDKDRLARGLGEAAARHGLELYTCACPTDYQRYGILRRGCIDLDEIGRANGVEFRNLKHKGIRKGCMCFESRDVGAYQTCPNGCRYCYANKDHGMAQAAYRDFLLAGEEALASPMLCDRLRPTDEISRGTQRSLIKPEKRVAVPTRSHGSQGQPLQKRGRGATRVAGVQAGAGRGRGAEAASPGQLLLFE